MSDLRFDQGWVLWLCCAWILLWPLRELRRNRTDSALLAWLGPRPLGPLLGRNERAIRLRRTGTDLAIALFLFAAAGPSIALRAEAGAVPLHLVTLLDVSRSMLAEDLRPSRLEAAKSAVQALTASLPESELGLIAFAGEPVLRLPLSRDRSAFSEILAASDPLDVPRGGTDLALALTRGARVFAEPANALRAVLLVTDGADEGARAAAVARELLAQGCLVFVLGVGTRYGAEIPIATSGGAREWLRDRNNNPVRVRLQLDSLRTVAHAGGGESFSLDSEGAIEGIRGAIAERRRAVAQQQQIADPSAREPLHASVLVAAFVIYGLALAGFERRRKRA